MSLVALCSKTQRKKQFRDEGILVWQDNFPGSYDIWHVVLPSPFASYVTRGRILYFPESKEK